MYRGHGEVEMHVIIMKIQEKSSSEIYVLFHIFTINSTSMPISFTLHIYIQLLDTVNCFTPSMYIHISMLTTMEK